MGVSSSTTRRNPSPYQLSSPYYYYPTDPYASQQPNGSNLGHSYYSPPYVPPYAAAYGAAGGGYYGGGYDGCNYGGGGYYGGGGQQQQQGLVMGQWGVGGRGREVVVAHPAPPYVEHWEAKRVRSSVNVHKESVRLVADEMNPGHYLVYFVFDALQDGRYTTFEL